MLQPESISAYLEPRHQPLAERLTAFVEDRLLPIEPAEDDPGARRQARELLRLLGDEGLCRFGVPAVYGGANEAIDLRACCLVREALAYASPLADSVFALQCLGSTPIALAAEESIRRRYLPGVASGDLMAAFAMTEPQAGSDAAAMTTAARRDGDEYVLDGRKTYITNAGVADFYTVFAKTDAEAGSRGISCFVVPAETPGLLFDRPQILSEPHPLGELVFDGCRVPVDHRLDEEGQGFKLAMRTLDRLRATVAAAANGMSLRALFEARRHALGRQMFGKTLADQQLTQDKLARMAIGLDAARLLTYRAAAVADRTTERVTRLSAMAKAFSTENAQRVIDDAIQIHGGAGLMMSHPVDRLYRAVRALRIYEGATEVQHIVIARDLLKRE